MSSFMLHHTVLVLVQVGAILFIGYLFRGVYLAKQERKHELSKQILDKMSSVEFLDLMKSPAGRQSIERLIGSEKSPEAWIREAFRRAVLLICAGIALIAVYPVLDFSGDEIPLILGAVSIGLGIGYLIAAVLTKARARDRESEG